MKRRLPAWPRRRRARDVMWCVARTGCATRRTPMVSGRDTRTAPIPRGLGVFRSGRIERGRRPGLTRLLLTPSSLKKRLVTIRTISILLSAPQRLMRSVKLWGGSMKSRSPWMKLIMATTPLASIRMPWFLTSNNNSMTTHQGAIAVPTLSKFSFVPRRRQAMHWPPLNMQLRRATNCVLWVRTRSR